MKEFWSNQQNYSAFNINKNWIFLWLWFFWRFIINVNIIMNIYFKIICFWNFSNGECWRWKMSWTKIWSNSIGTEVFWRLRIEVESANCKDNCYDWFILKDQSLMSTVRKNWLKNLSNTTLSDHESSKMKNWFDCTDKKHRQRNQSEVKNIAKKSIQNKIEVCLNEAL